jgi:N-acetylglucosamine kinase-like BadF-type ATPase
LPSNTRQYLLAIDGGGSKTVFCLCDCATGEDKFYRLGSSNYKITRVKSERDVILEGIKSLLEQAGADAGQVVGLVMGMSGCDSPGDHMHYLSIAAESGIARDKIYVCNDSELAFYSKGRPPGLCMIAGTGSVATGVGADRKKARAGGWGSPISDEGSGGWIGIQVLKALLRYCDGYGEYRPVFEALRRHYQSASFEELPRRLSQVTMGEIAGAARPTMDMADAGDPFCLGLVGEAALLAAEVALSIYRKLQFQNQPLVDIVMAGSLYKSPTFNAAFRKNLIGLAKKDNMVFYDGVKKPVLGGVALAREMFLQRDPPDQALKNFQSIQKTI